MIKMHSSLTIMGDDLPFDEITSVLGVEPTRVRRAAEAPQGALVRCDKWELDHVGLYDLPDPPGSDEDATIPYPEATMQFDRMRDAIGTREQAFQEWRRDHPVEVWLTAGILTSTPMLGLVTAPNQGEMSDSDHALGAHHVPLLVPSVLTSAVLAVRLFATGSGRGAILTNHHMLDALASAVIDGLNKALAFFGLPPL